MPDDIFESRERAFEAVYFAKQDAELIEKAKREREADANRERLSLATGIQDVAVLDMIIQQGIREDTLEALQLAPLVSVAWANGEVEPEERASLLEALDAMGVESGTPGRDLVESWLAAPPDPALMKTWKTFVESVVGTLESPAREAMRETILKRATKIARAAGGFAGIGSISAKEQAVLDQIEAALE